MIALLLTVAARWRRQRGVIALLTLVWMMTLGVVCWFTLWAIGWATGQYDVLYSSAQEAAYAAVGTALPTSNGSEQLAFDCGIRYSPLTGVCPGGQTLAAVHRVLAASLGPGIPGRFGLCYGSGCGQQNVQLTEAQQPAGSGQPADEVYAFNIGIPPGLAQKDDPNRTCPATVPDPNGGGQVRACWQVPAYLGTSVPHYTSGVMLSVTAQAPMCSSLLCLAVGSNQISLTVAAAQQNAAAQPYG